MCVCLHAYISKIVCACVHKSNLCLACEQGAVDLAKGATFSVFSKISQYKQ